MKPMLFQTLKSYSAKQFTSDVISGIIVAIIALPLSIALAIASGVGPERGIYTAVIAGFVISFLGGSQVQIAGPTAAFATIVAGIVAGENGMEKLFVATIIAGVLLLLMGIFKFGNLIKFIPFTITTGFTAGIAVTIVLGQIKDFFGITYAEGLTPVETLEKVEALAFSFGTLQWEAIVIGLISLLVLVITPRINHRIPGSLIAVIISIVLVMFVPIFQDVTTIGDQYSNIPVGLPKLEIPELSVELFQGAFSDGLTIAILAAIESLLSCVVADGMIHGKHNSNMELVAQGAGNIASVLFGGIPATGAIARTAANVKNGGRTPVAGMVHALVLLLVLLVLMPYAKLIPMPTIAAILIMVAYNMCQWRTFVHMVKTAPKSDIAVLFATFILTVVFDLVVAIEIGMVMACVFFLKRMSEETDVKSWKQSVEHNETNDEERQLLMNMSDTIRVYEITGPLFFGAADCLDHITVKDQTRVLIIRMRSVPALDSTAMNSLEHLYERCQKRGIVMILSHVNAQPMHAMQKAGFVKLVGKENFRPHITSAVAYAETLVK